jgi:serine/threonine-protein kinase
MPALNGPPSAGLALGRYRILAKLGQGGMSEVLLASVQGSRGVSKLSVIKRLRPDLSNGDRPSLDGVNTAQHFASMFLEEAKITCRLNHPNIVHTYEVGEEAGQLCIVMEYIEGESLHAVYRRLIKLGRTMRPALAARVMSEVLAGLHYAHELADYGGAPLNIVHRDVSPHNVMISYQGGVKLLDFGIAKASSREIETEVGVLKGKVHYMAPEQAQSKGVDRRSDVFSAGVVLWELLTLRRLVQGDTPVSSWFSLLNDPFPRPSTLVEGLDPRLDAIVMRALERDPAMRYPSALAMREALEEYVAATSEGVGVEHVGRLVGELFEETRSARAQQIRAFLEAPAARPSGDLHPTAVLSEPGPLEGTPTAAPFLPTILPGGDVAADPPVVRPGRRLASLLLGGAAVALAFSGFYAYGRLGSLRDGEGARAMLRASASVAPSGRDLVALAASLPPAPPVAPGPSSESAATPDAADPSAPAVKPDPAEAAPSLRREKPEAPRKGAPPTRQRPPSARASEAPLPADEPTGNGFLTLDTYPWTRVTEGGRVLGTTPLVRVPLSPGVHTLMLENPGENVKKMTTITVKSGENISRRLAFQ